MAERVERCDRCRWWKSNRDGAPDDDDTSGECRRLAPRALVLRRRDDDPYQEFPAWPLTMGDEFCGEFAPLTAEAPPVTAEES